MSFFIFLINSASFSSHSSFVLAYTFLDMRFPSAPLGEYLPSYRWSFILLIQPVPLLRILPFVGSNLACGCCSCCLSVISLSATVFFPNRLSILFAAYFFIASVLCRYVSRAVLLDTCPIISDSVFASIPFSIKWI